ncbi:roadblock/LC7 domain-containing protein [Streptomyces sp. SID1121]|uniref:roadblock/LC7 domain-containing protein n=1 Tax=Streptomyces sp. SID1121 TaxID=3425888 RepID=UPI004057A9F5
MTENLSPGQTKELGFLLDDFAQRVQGTLYIVLASSDGLVKQSFGLDRNAADPLGAALSGMLSLAKSIAKYNKRPLGVRQIVTEYPDFNLFVSAAGSGSLIGVATERETDAAMVGYELNALVRSTAPHLSTAVRDDVAAVTDGP